MITPVVIRRGDSLKHAETFLLLVTVFLVMPAQSDAHGEILSEDDVRALSWPVALPMTLLAASDRVFDGGRDYVYGDDDPWLNESDVVEHSRGFTISIRNTNIYLVDSVLFLIAHKGGTFSAMTVDGYALGPDDFKPFKGTPFGPTGNRPGAGESALYNTADGIVFLRIPRAVLPQSTAEIPVEVLPKGVDFVMHFDVYGLRRSRVFCSCPSTSDVTCRPVPSATATPTEVRGEARGLFSP